MSVLDNKIVITEENDVIQQIIISGDASTEGKDFCTTFIAKVMNGEAEMIFNREKLKMYLKHPEYGEEAFSLKETEFEAVRVFMEETKIKVGLSDIWCGSMTFTRI